jgi:hypothetical protein
MRFNTGLGCTVGTKGTSDLREDERQTDRNGPLTPKGSNFSKEIRESPERAALS